LNINCGNSMEGKQGMDLCNVKDARKRNEEKGGV
jgi:hypothetical protein